MKSGINSRLIILDRDGVINHDSDHYIKSPDEWRPIPGSLAAIARLNQADYRVAVATNQSGIARGYFNRATLEAIHQKLMMLLAGQGGHIDYLAYCPHGPTQACECRKPKPGLLREIAQALKIPLTPQVIMVGDSLRDLRAAYTANCSAVLVSTGKGEKSIANRDKDPDPRIRATPIYTDLKAFVDDLLAGKNDA